jgi:voltage-gated potassium channel Kch
VKLAFPNLPIFARAYDRIHAYRLLHLGVREIAIETSGSAIVLGTEVLKALGISEARAHQNAQAFQRGNENSIRELAKRFHEEDRESFIKASAQSSQQLEAMFASDPTQIGNTGV